MMLKRGKYYVFGNYTVYTGWYFQNEYKLADMIGNVSEITATKGISKGGSWCHKLDSCKIKINIPYEGPTKWLGFRCVARWITAEQLIGEYD